MKKLLFILWGLYFPIILHGQISIVSEPFALKNSLPKTELLSKSETVLPYKNISEALLEDKIDMEKGRPPRFISKTLNYIRN